MHQWPLEALLLLKSIKYKQSPHKEQKRKEEQIRQRIIGIDSEMVTFKEINGIEQT